MVLNKDYITFARNGEIKQFNNVVGTWKKHCPKRTSRYRGSTGLKLVSHYYTAVLTNGKDFFGYTQKELKECLDRKTI
jgi:hypothetical protein